MASAMESMVAANYVRDIGRSRAFYELLGFREHSAGTADTAAWSLLRNGAHRVLLASTSPPLDIPRFPLLFYFFYDDLDAVARTLAEAGVAVAPTGHPPHALGGEVKVADPDGNTILLGQPERSASQPDAKESDTSLRFSLLKEAALVAGRGGASTTCQAPCRGGGQCREQAEVKLADTAGGSAWACLEHAHEILVSVPGTFIANDEAGIARYLARRRR